MKTILGLTFWCLMMVSLALVAGWFLIRECTLARQGVEVPAKVEQLTGYRNIKRGSDNYSYYVTFTTPNGQQGHAIEYSDGARINRVWVHANDPTNFALLRDNDTYSIWFRYRIYFASAYLLFIGFVISTVLMAWFRSGRFRVAASIRPRKSAQGD